LNTKNISDLIIDIIESKSLEVDKYLNKAVNSKINTKTCTVEEFNIKNKTEAKEIGKDIGSYILISIKDVRYSSDTLKNKYIKIISENLIKLLPKLSTNNEIIIVGLGNQNVESDSLGYNVAKNIIVTRFLDNTKNNWPKISAITPSVMGITGIESADIIESIVQKIAPKCIIVIDSLCASSPKRLGTSIQLSNAGIIPGGGILQPKKVLNKNSIGCDVISIGVPLMIFAKSFCNNNEIIDQNLIVTFHDIGEIVKILGKMIAHAINKTLLGIEKI